MSHYVKQVRHERPHTDSIYAPHHTEQIQGQQAGRRSPGASRRGQGTAPAQGAWGFPAGGGGKTHPSQQAAPAGALLTPSRQMDVSFSLPSSDSPAPWQIPSGCPTDLSIPESASADRVRPHRLRLGPQAASVRCPCPINRRLLRRPPGIQSFARTAYGIQGTLYSLCEQFITKCTQLSIS